MKRCSGFTLIELMIVVTIIAIISAIAIPNIIRARIAANETSAIANLRSLATAQEAIRANVLVDQDFDGIGEYGLLRELTGAANVRGSTSRKANPPFISLNEVESAGVVSKSGYVTRVFLPGVVTDSDFDNLDNLPTQLDIDDAINAQENRWIAYSWPAAFETTGIRCFVVDQGSEVLGASNINEYSGLPSGPNVASTAKPIRSVSKAQRSGGPRNPNPPSEPNLPSTPQYNAALSIETHIDRIAWGKIAINDNGTAIGADIWKPSN